ncbi:MAG: DUF4278 domain-containing protein, partial [Cyanobacteria bacterium P01_G01_bin.49]
NFLAIGLRVGKTAIGGNQLMKLLFRGISYDYQPVVLEPSDREIEGTYRGIHWISHPYQKSHNHQKDQEMIYRGIHYRQN